MDGTERQRKEATSRRADLFLAALLESPTLTEAAATAQLSRRDATRIYANSEFKTRLREATDEIINNSLNRAKTRIGAALAVIEEVMGDTETPRAVRVSAAKAMIDIAFKAVETSDILERLASLETAIKEAHSVSGGV
jgi:uncharacterized protein (UPF0147 family)